MQIGNEVTHDSFSKQVSVRVHAVGNAGGAQRGGEDVGLGVGAVQDGGVTGMLEEPAVDKGADLMGNALSFGLGIFGANSCVRDRGWTDGQWAGWSVDKAGYLQQATWAYALAVFARVRGDPCPAWRRHLRPDVRAAFKAGVKPTQIARQFGLSDADVRRALASDEKKR